MRTTSITRKLCPYFFHWPCNCPVQTTTETTEEKAAPTEDGK